jgi:hypothetical protein
MRSGWLGVAALAVIALTVPVSGLHSHAAAEAANLVGQVPEEIQVSDWMNSDGRTRLADFRGEVLLVKAWGTN